MGLLSDTRPLTRSPSTFAVGPKTCHTAGSVRRKPEGNPLADPPGRRGPRGAYTFQESVGPRLNPRTESLAVCRSVSPEGARFPTGHGTLRRAHCNRAAALPVPKDGCHVRPRFPERRGVRSVVGWSCAFDLPKGAIPLARGVRQLLRREADSSQTRLYCGHRPTEVVRRHCFLRWTEAPRRKRLPHAGNRS